MRVRGLKLFGYLNASYLNVAPHAGAWIETYALPIRRFPTASHPMRVRGLKQNLQDIVPLPRCRTPCGCVD